MCIPIYSKVATCTNFAEYFSTVETEKGHENFPSFNHNCRSRNLRTVAMCMYMCAGLKHFFTTTPHGSYGRRDQLRDESRVFAHRVTRESHSVLEIQEKGWAKAMVAGKCDEAKIKSTRGTNKMGRKETGG